MEIMEITKIKSTRWLYKSNCDKCGKEINAVSEKMLKHNYKMHKHYCKAGKNGTSNKIRKRHNLETGD